VPRRLSRCCRGSPGLRKHFPSILKALAERQGAEGKVTESLGAFDLVFAPTALIALTGFYDGTALGGKVIKPLRPLGAKLYGEYSLSNGDFPIYEDSNFTNNGGTAKLGVLFSLLRDRDIDKRRFGRSTRSWRCSRRISRCS
jgi:hypothetical protein